MDISRQPEVLINVEGDDLDTVAKKLGVESTLEAEIIVLKEENLSYLNYERDPDGNTILMKFARLGKEDIVGFLVKCDGIRLNEENRQHETAADIALSEGKFGCLLKLLQEEAEFPYMRDMSRVKHRGLVEFIERRQKLHEDIETGDLLSVKEFTKNHKRSMYLSYKFGSFCRIHSALYWAAECDQLEVYAYLCSHGAKFKDSSEEKRCRFDDKKRNELNRLLGEYFAKVDNSHVLKLMHSSHSPQSFSDVQKAKIKDIYEHLNSLKFVSLIMKVLEYEDVDVVFDFENEHTNRVYCLNNSQIYGFTLPRMQRIFIGAEKCESAETVSMDVAGTLAHELCHMAMQVLYRNEANPYSAGEEATEVFEKYEGVVTNIKKYCEETTEKIDPVIKMVFKYKRYDWHSELIVRVPHIIAMYGDVEGKALLQKQAKGLFEFYSDHVVPKCEEYTNSAFFNKGLCMIESLHKHHGCLQDVDKEIPPLKEPFKSFKNYLIPTGNISLIATNNTRLCSLHIYHELKTSYSCHFDKKCLFFKLDCFKSNWQKIMDAFRCNVCEYMVLITNENMLNFKDISEDFNDVKGCGKDKDASDCEGTKKVILLVNEECEGLRVYSRKKVLKYQWSDLSDRYKKHLIRQNSGLVVNFKGKDTCLRRWIDEKKLSEIIHPEDMQRLTNNDQIQLSDGMRLISRGYNEEYYMKREFVKISIRKSVFDEPDDSTALFITGLGKEHFERFGIDQGRTQWIDYLAEEIEPGKHIFIQPTEKEDMTFFDKLSSSRLFLDSVYWLHFSKEEFYLRMSNGSTKAIEEHIKEETFTERQLVEVSKERVVLISGDPGMGKSTVLTELIRIIKDDNPDWWVGRIDLSDYADDKENPLSLANIEKDSKADDVLNIFIRMLGMKTKLEVYLFTQFVKPKGLKREYKIIFDAFDEISPSYKDNVLRLFRCLIKETTLQLWITTRRHEKLCLEAEFDTFSYCLKEFTVDTQVRFLDNLWKHRMKSLVVQNSEEECLSVIEMIGEKIEAILEEKGDLDFDVILSLKGLKGELENGNSKATCYEELEGLRLGIEGLDFTRSATLLVNVAAIEVDENRFLGIPLHIFMLGNVAYDNHFRGGKYSNVHALYSEFVKGKIRVLLKEKSKLAVENDIGKNMFNCLMVKITKFHKSGAKCVIDPDSYSWDSIMDSDDLELDIRVGIVTKLGDQFQFVHRTFAEFFFSEWLLEMIQFGKLEEKTLKKVMLEDRHSVVRRFLDGAFQRDCIRDTLNKALIEKWNVAEIFSICYERAKKGDFTGKWLLRAILSELEKESNPTFGTLINEISTPVFKSYDLITYVLKLLNFCFSDALIFELVDKHIESKVDRVFSCILLCSADDVSEVLGVFRRAYRMKESHFGRDDYSGAHSRVKEGNGDGPETIEAIKTACGGENRMRLFDHKDYFGNDLLHIAAANKDGNVFGKVTGLVKEFLGEEGLVNLVLERDNRGRTVLHSGAINSGRGILTVMREIESIVDSVSFARLLRTRDNRGANFLFCAAEFCRREAFKSLTEYLDKLVEVNALRDLFLDEDRFGGNIFHGAAKNDDISTFDFALGILRSQSENEEKFAEFVSRCDKFGRTVFHYRAREKCPIGDLILLESHIGSEKLRGLLAKVNNRRETCLHVVFEYSLYSEYISSGLRLFSDLFDVDSLEKIIWATDVKGNTVVHKSAMKHNLLHRDEWRHIFKGYLSESSSQMLMKLSNNAGEIVRTVGDSYLIKLKLHKEQPNVTTRIVNRVRNLFKQLFSAVNLRFMYMTGWLYGWLQPRLVLPSPTTT